MLPKNKQTTTTNKVGHTWAVHSITTFVTGQWDMCKNQIFVRQIITRPVPCIRKYFVILTYHCFSFRLCLAGFLLFSNVFCQWFHLAYKFKYNTENVSTHRNLQPSVIIIFHFFIHVLLFFTDIAFYYSDSIQPEDSYLSMTLQKSL